MDDRDDVEPVDSLPSGVQPIEHTADIAMRVDATTLPGLFDRAALALVALLASGEAPPIVPDPKADVGGDLSLALDADDVSLLLADWLRELLFLSETRHACFVGADFESIDEHSLRAVVHLRPCPRFVREIKGVTYHALDVRQVDGAWRATVVFDV